VIVAEVAEEEEEEKSRRGRRGSEEDGEAAAAANLAQLRSTRWHASPSSATCSADGQGLRKSMATAASNTDKLQQQISEELMQFRFLGQASGRPVRNHGAGWWKKCAACERSIQELLRDQGSHAASRTSSGVPAHEGNLDWVKHEIAAPYSETLLRSRPAIRRPAEEDAGACNNAWVFPSST